MMLSDIPRFFQRGQMHVETALIQVSPPDKYGYCSFGVNVDIAKPIAEAANHVIAEINPRMPRTLGDSFIHMDKISGFIPANHEIIEFKYDKPDYTIKYIAKYVASLIEDESTIQTGIGLVPNAVTTKLMDKKDLGVHTEVFSDGMVDLIEAGVVTCEKKTINKGKVICSFVIGSRKSYDYIDDNPMFEFHPTSYCNDPFIIAQNKKQISINAALSVDLTGQVNADSLGPQFYSGIGGQMDFMRGASRSEGGKPITVLPSTATLEDGTVISRIVPFLNPGSGVVVTRGDVHYVITEWGIAYLFGASIRERVLKLINIAHPDFREELLEYAKKVNYVYADQRLPKSIKGRISLYPEKYEALFELKDGTKLKTRPVKPTDERMLQQLYYSMDERDRFLRFFSRIHSFSHKRMQPLVNIDYDTKMILVGESQEEGEQKLVASAAYFKTKNPSIAEISCVVHKDWRRKGITTILINYLVDIAREHNIKYLIGTVLTENKPMIQVVNTLNFPLTFKNLKGGEVEFTYDIAKPISE
jgi:acyl-CoA hydrolase/GNAT superfamily N-acetyltransferase